MQDHPRAASPGAQSRFDGQVEQQRDSLHQQKGNKADRHSYAALLALMQAMMMARDEGTARRIAAGQEAVTADHLASSRQNN
ncbi:MULTISPECIES: hypothetical protein [unclassified Sphingomonas]|uniref:hypothetical protein n=1 Tax=unclassified Sphingomonas TaxID=196159 RepID=UPI00226B171C|nr:MULTISPECIES: hypothetical protein [unclassified Sphingomonas]